MESSMCRTVRGRVGRDVVETGGAVTSDDAVGHGLAAGDGRLIFEVEEDVGLGWGVEGFAVPSWSLEIFINQFIDSLVSVCGEERTDSGQTTEFLDAAFEEAGWLCS